MSNYETAAAYISRGTPDWARKLLARVAQNEPAAAQRVEPEPCCCCRVPAVVRRPKANGKGVRALCRGCASVEDKHLRRIKERKAKPGLIGLAVPFDVPTKIGSGNHWEIFEHGSLDETIVPIRRGHEGEPLSLGRAFPTRHGLCFDADMLRPEAIAAWAKGVSIGFSRNSVQSTTERYQGGTLERITKAKLTEIALLGGSERAAYRSAWCFPRSAQGWTRLYASMQREYAQIQRGEA